MNTAKIKTADAIGPALDWLVESVEIARMRAAGEYLKEWWVQKKQTDPSPYSADWLLAGPLIEREGISVIRVDDDYGIDNKGYCNNKRIPVWCATRGQHGITTSTEHESHEAMYQVYEAEVTYGPTPLIAAMRCYVAFKLGDDVEIPEELL